MDRTKMSRRAVCRWLVTNLEPGKTSNIDFLDLIDRFNDHANSELAGLQISNSRLVSYLEEQFRGAKFDEKTNRIHGVNWRKVEPKVWEPIPTKSPEDSALEVRFTTFLSQGSVFVQRGEKGFTTAAFANWRDSWLTSIGAQIRHDKIDFDEAQSWLESRSDLVRYDEASQSWFITNNY